ncbi:PREDICTED: kinesin-like protein KIN-8B [Tarenaya hassleriana]|uniref:kinesin-like protein KIN-8B n=1 Tax=Tarenaya hassleriana TaxID=28532 RepID=UPI00053C3F30|nr:PREDICTED: kinesin-like protein KIN-8B [Tarenaya hassleriana]
MPSIRAPAAKKTTTLTVAVKCRPLMEKERGRDIVRVNDSKEVIVLDPDLSKDYLDRIQNRTKEKKYCFDHAFGPKSMNKDVYRSISSVISGVVHGLNATVFAYGSTGSGKTYTMVGTQNDPGLMVLSLNTIFDLIKSDKSSNEFEVTCSYLEVYNEVIYDLLEKSSGHLELREDPEQGIVVSGLRSIKVHSTDRILELLNLGNSRRKTESTEMNGTSSRSHAVLEITVKRRPKNQNQVMKGKLALVDLAGSERASETNNGGQKLRDGANINRSLLALANCINALGKQHKKGLAYVPYRNSKLTRILKDGLSGNSQTVMIATISPADSQYHHTVNTLKYADRAKEIKTHIQKNIGTIDTHVSDYQRMIDSLQSEVCQLKKQLAEKESQLSIKPFERSVDGEVSWLDALSHQISENVQDRINLQKALFELEETNLRNRTELQHLDDAIVKQVTEKEQAIVEALRTRRQVILDNIRDNDEAGVNYQTEIEENEKHRCEIQDMLNEAINNNGNKTYLHILNQYKLLGMANIELQFEMAMRDQIIYNQREAQRNLWNLLMGLGVEEKHIFELAAKQGITIEDWSMQPYPGIPYQKQSLPGRYSPLRNIPDMGHSYSQSSCTLQSYQNFGTNSPSKGQWAPAPTFCREEHHSSYYFMGQDSSSSQFVNLRKSYDGWVGGRPASWLNNTGGSHPRGLLGSYPQSQTVNHSSPQTESWMVSSHMGTNFYQPQRDIWMNTASQRPPYASPRAGTSGTTAHPFCGSPRAAISSAQIFYGSPRAGTSGTTSHPFGGSPRAVINSAPVSYGSPRATTTISSSGNGGGGSNQHLYGSPRAMQSRSRSNLHRGSKTKRR